MDMYVDSQDNKKKLLIPLVVLLLCVVSLTGAAYAYYVNTSVEIDGNPIDGEYYSIDYTDSNKVSITAPIVGDGQDFLISTQKVIEDDGVVSFLAHTNETTFTREFYITVFTDMDDSQTFTLSAVCTWDDEVLDKLFTVESATPVVCNGNEATKITVSYSVKDVDFNTIGLTTNITDAVSLAEAVNELKTGHTIDFTVTATPVSA